MAARDEARTFGQGRKDQEHGGDLSTFVAHQGVPDCGLLSAQIEGRGDEGEEAIFHISRCEGSERRSELQIADAVWWECRSSPSRSKLAPVNVPDSRPSSSLATPKATSVSASRPPKKSPLPSAPPSSLPS